MTHSPVEPHGVLLLTGGPAAGKSTVAGLVSARLPRCAVLDVDTVRHFVTSGHAAPWEGREGRRQQLLGVRNTCAVAANLRAAGIPVVITDVVQDRTAVLYRRLLAQIRIVWLDLSRQEARRRAEGRPIHLTWDEFARLHEQQGALTEFDRRIDVTALSAEQVADSIGTP